MYDGRKSEILGAFTAYLDEVELESDTGPGDLHSLFSELAVLRTEVKTQARQFKEALEEFRNGFDALGQSHAQLRQAGEERQQEIRRGFLLDLLEIHDRMSDSLAAMDRYQPKGRAMSGARKQDRTFIHSVQEGQAIALRRVEQLLRQHQLTPIDVINQAFDPHTMKVVELEHHPELEEGIVTSQTRRGFYWEAGVLRLAEVKVNKRGNGGNGDNGDNE